MPRKSRTPVTAGSRVLRAAGVTFSDHLYDYQEKAGTPRAARELGVDEHTVVKTLVFETDNGDPFLVLMHGDKTVSAKNMARVIGAKTVVPCAPETAQKHTGYRIGGISPFGTRKPLSVYLQQTILDLPIIYINAGHRGYLAGIDPAEIVRVLKAKPVDVAI